MTFSFIFFTHYDNKCRILGSSTSAITLFGMKTNLCIYYVSCQSHLQSMGPRIRLHHKLLVFFVGQSFGTQLINFKSRVFLSIKER